MWSNDGLMLAPGFVYPHRVSLFGLVQSANFNPRVCSISVRNNGAGERAQVSDIKRANVRAKFVGNEHGANTSVDESEGENTAKDMIKQPEKTNASRTIDAADGVDNVDPMEGKQHQESSRKGQKHGRKLSAEIRAKISAALKGRRKSAEHRERLSKRFAGSRNPMYGKSVSAETRAKISAALLARQQKKLQQEEEQMRGMSAGDDSSTLETREEDPDSRNLLSVEELREKALVSRLVSSLSSEPSSLKTRRSEENVDSILKRVANLNVPPDNVAKLIHETEEKRRANKHTAPTENDSRDTKSPSISVVDNENVQQKRLSSQEESRKTFAETCPKCKGSGMTSCEHCVGTFGVPSTRCAVCFGTGSDFCKLCDGAGHIHS